jgi:hypothetical protein
VAIDMAVVGKAIAKRNDMRERSRLRRRCRRATEQDKER